MVKIGKFELTMENLALVFGKDWSELKEDKLFMQLFTTMSLIVFGSFGFIKWLYPMLFKFFFLIGCLNALGLLWWFIERRLAKRKEKLGKIYKLSWISKYYISKCKSSICNSKSSRFTKTKMKGGKKHE